MTLRGGKRKGEAWQRTYDISVDCRYCKACDLWTASCCIAWLISLGVSVLASRLGLRLCTVICPATGSSSYHY
ncbi:hypothetical protein V6N13_014297 [Hibiscus sabdariffa]|uniref:Uncharacterized protein n=1 Tax=Hibiscus sabdariffa TaxID=183260 RepID=A0ABR2RVD8_9ROSI